MPGYDDAYERSADEPAFSNSTEGDAWMQRWCLRCVHDEAADRAGCPLVLISFLGRTPAEWAEKDRGSLGNQYECAVFSPAS